MHVQNQQRGLTTLLGKGGGGAAPFPADNDVVGHSSVKDAPAALRLYWHRSVKWEQSLEYDTPFGLSGMMPGAVVADDLSLDRRYSAIIGTDCCHWY